MMKEAEPQENRGESGREDFDGLEGLKAQREAG
jgi:hypothetical protein